MDIDFTTDIRNDDTVKIVVEGLYLDGQFKKYGDLLSAELRMTARCIKLTALRIMESPDTMTRQANLSKRHFLKHP